ncbi:MAG: PEP-CTERM sorting domain-containing protein [Phycisphaerae bacterium]|nr:PEP-CTERM sorting domain-containing protein [Phycisphaerae bacterium]
MKFCAVIRLIAFLVLATYLAGTTPAWARLINGGTADTPLAEVGGDCDGTLYAATTVETWANLTGSFTDVGGWNAIRFGNDHAAHLNLDCNIGAGDAYAYGGIHFGYNGNVDGSTFTVNGGTIYADRLFVGGSASTTATGKVTVVITGGTIDTQYGVQLGVGANSTFDVTQTGGTVSWKANGVTVGVAGSGIYTISGGELITTDDGTGAMMISAGSTFHVDGAKAKIFVLNKFRLVGTAIFTVHPDGVSPLEVGGLNDSEQGGEIKMALAPGFTPKQGALYTLIDTDHTPFHLDALPITLSPENAGTWEFAVKEGDYTVLQARYLLPEPATMAMLGLGMLGLMARRRRS